ELFEVQFHHAGKYGCKCTNNWNKASNNQGRTTIFLVEFFSHDNIFLLKNQRVFPFEQHGACSVAKPISGKVARNTGREDAEKHGRYTNVDLVQRTKQPRQKQ